MIRIAALAAVVGTTAAANLAGHAPAGSTVCSRTACVVTAAGHTEVHDWHAKEAHGDHHYCASDLATKTCTCYCGSAAVMGGTSTLVHDANGVKKVINIRADSNEESNDNSAAWTHPPTPAPTPAPDIKINFGAAKFTVRGETKVSLEAPPQQTALDNMESRLHSLAAARGVSVVHVSRPASGIADGVVTAIRLAVRVRHANRFQTNVACNGDYDIAMDELEDAIAHLETGAQAATAAANVPRAQAAALASGTVVDANGIKLWQEGGKWWLVPERSDVLVSCASMTDSFQHMRNLIDAVSAAPIVSCEVGHWADRKQRACRLCPEGTMQPTAGKDSCTLCPEGAFAAAPGAASCAAHSPACVAGQNEVAPATHVSDRQCADCAAGTYDHDGDPLTPCRAQPAECAPGTRQSVAPTPTSARACTACEAGAFSATPGALACATHRAPCEAGFFQAIAATASVDRQCGECPPGTAKAAADEASHGLVGAASAAHSCVACAHGSFSGVGGGVACFPWSLPCGPGSTERAPPSATQQRVCEPCAKGTFSVGTNQTCVNTTACAVGWFERIMPTLHSDRKCAACVAGQYGVNGTVCLDCAAGTFSATPGATECAEWTSAACDAGTRLMVHPSATADIECKDCAAGRATGAGGMSFVRGDGWLGTMCMNCPAGQFAEEGSPYCEACEAGKWAESEAEECEDCAKGQIAANDGSEECTACEAGQYVDKEGKALCEVCAAGHFSVTNAVAIKACAKHAACAADEFAAAEGTAKADTTCKKLTTCAAGKEFESKAATASSDRECTPVTAAPTSAPSAAPTPAPTAAPTPAPVDCAVSAFGEFSTCTEPCGSGVQSRSRTVATQPANGGKTCPGLQEKQNCNTHACPIHCQYTLGVWSECSKSCGGGTQRKPMTVTVHAAHRGTACPEELQRVCNELTCPTPTPTAAPTAAPSMSPTRAPTPESKCSGSDSTVFPTGKCCDFSTKRVRTGAQATSWRWCQDTFPTAAPTAAPTDAPTAAPTLAPTAAPTPAPVDCAVSAFRGYSACTEPCGGGVQSRSRTVAAQARHGGSACPTLSEEQNCNTQPCAVDCIATVHAWIACSKSCGGGDQTRPVMVHTPSAHGGAACPAASQRMCNAQACPTPAPTAAPTPAPTAAPTPAPTPYIDPCEGKTKANWCHGHGTPKTKGAVCACTCKRPYSGTRCTAWATTGDSGKTCTSCSSLKPLKRKKSNKKRGGDEEEGGSAAGDARDALQTYDDAQAAAQMGAELAKYDYAQEVEVKLCNETIATGLLANFINVPPPIQDIMGAIGFPLAWGIQSGEAVQGANDACAALPLDTNLNYVFLALNDPTEMFELLPDAQGEHEEENSKALGKRKTAKNDDSDSGPPDLPFLPICLAMRPCATGRGLGSGVDFAIGLSGMEIEIAVPIIVGPPPVIVGYINVLIIFKGLAFSSAGELSMASNLAEGLWDGTRNGEAQWITSVPAHFWAGLEIEIGFAPPQAPTEPVVTIGIDGAMGCWGAVNGEPNLAIIIGGLVKDPLSLLQIAHLEAKVMFTADITATLELANLMPIPGIDSIEITARSSLYVGVAAGLDGSVQMDMNFGFEVDMLAPATALLEAYQLDWLLPMPSLLGETGLFLKFVKGAGFDPVNPRIDMFAGLRMKATATVECPAIFEAVIGLIPGLSDMCGASTSVTMTIEKAPGRAGLIGGFDMCLDLAASVDSGGVGVSLCASDIKCVGGFMCPGGGVCLREGRGEHSGACVKQCGPNQFVSQIRDQYGPCVGCCREKMAPFEGNWAEAVAFSPSYVGLQDRDVACKSPGVSDLKEMSFEHFCVRPDIFNNHDPCVADAQCRGPGSTCDVSADMTKHSIASLAVPRCWAHSDADCAHLADTCYSGGNTRTCTKLPGRVRAQHVTRTCTKLPGIRAQHVAGISSSHGNTQDQCRAKCEQNTACKQAVFSEGTCWLESVASDGHADTLGKAWDSWHCDNVAGISSSSGNTPDQCRAKCEQNTACKQAVFSEGTCWLESVASDGHADTHGKAWDSWHCYTGVCKHGRIFQWNNYCTDCAVDSDCVDTHFCETLQGPDRLTKYPLRFCRRRYPSVKDEGSTTWSSVFPFSRPNANLLGSEHKQGHRRCKSGVAATKMFSLALSDTYCASGELEMGSNCWANAACKYGNCVCPDIHDAIIGGLSGNERACQCKCRDNADCGLKEFCDKSEAGTGCRERLGDGAYYIEGPTVLTKSQIDSRAHNWCRSGSGKRAGLCDLRRRRLVDTSAGSEAAIAAVSRKAADAALHLHLNAVHRTRALRRLAGARTVGAQAMTARAGTSQDSTEFEAALLAKGSVLKLVVKAGNVVADAANTVQDAAEQGFNEARRVASTTVNVAVETATAAGNVAAVAANTAQDAAQDAADATAAVATAVANLACNNVLIAGYHCKGSCGATGWPCTSAQEWQAKKDAAEEQAEKVRLEQLRASAEAAQQTAAEKRAKFLVSKGPADTAARALACAVEANTLQTYATKKRTCTKLPGIRAQHVAGISSSSGNTPDQCRAKCEQNTACVQAVFSEGTCYLESVASDGHADTHGKAWDSWHCYTSVCTKLPAIRAQTTAVIPSSSGNTPDQCRAKCEQNTACEQAVFSEGTCWLESVASDGQADTLGKAWDSWHCDNTRSCTSLPGIRAQHVAGIPSSISSSHGNTQDQCRAKCEQNTACEQAVFSEGTCWLESVASDGHADTHGKAFTSWQCVHTTTPCLVPLTCNGQPDGPTMINPDGGDPFEVECSGGWTMIQERTSNTNFYRPWSDYATGFGDHANFWVGNEQIHRITEVTSMAQVQMWSGNDFRYAKYSTFKVGDAASKYQLTVGGYSGDAGDSLSIHSGQRFSTYDQDNDTRGGNCAKDYHGAWWYYDCHKSNLNGKYHTPGNHNSYADGINWDAWKGFHHSMSKTKIMLAGIYHSSPTH
jgi:ficolin